MESKPRIQSILETKSLDCSSFGIEPFHLSDLVLPTIPNIDITENIRLGHRVEKIVSNLIEASTNYKIHYENLQIKEGNKTIGEIDFIIEEIQTKLLIHLELAYKFYLFDPSLSTTQFDNWIGPNRNDSLKEKVEKLRDKQFPLLHNPQTKALVTDIDTDAIRQQLCLLSSLYVPYQSKVQLEPKYQKAVKGYFLEFNLFKTLEYKDKSFYIPAKKDWGINPESNKVWYTFQEIENYLNTSIVENQSVLCWQKNKDTYAEYFIVWW
jgi:hypothetical protein